MTTAISNNLRSILVGPLGAMAVGILWLLFWYRSTALSMAEIWYRSETFNHGFLVLPISLWLVWRKRASLAQQPVKPSIWALPILALAGSGWLLGDLAGANAVAQFALICLLVLLVPAILGTAITRHLAFPLAFLLFMVPVGEFALPTLMDWTARFTVVALRFSGVPVYQEGLHFVIPSGNWSVIETCSGVRYLIASVCVGSLFSHLNFVSLNRRLLFIAISVVVPIVANWVRAYMIVMIGHLSSNQLAVGVDHLIYGWVFFGIVILIMFGIGARWSEQPVPLDTSNLRTPELQNRPSIPLMLSAALVIIVAPHIGKISIESAESGPAVELAALGDVPEWTITNTTAPWQPAFQQPDASSSKMFSRGAETVGLHIVYYRNQDYQRKLVSSANVLVQSMDKEWAIVSNGSKAVDLYGKTIAVRTAKLRSDSGQRLTVWHWYSINGRITSSDHLAKLHTAYDRLRGRGDDAAGIFIFAPSDLASPETTLETFLRNLASPLQAALDRTSDQG